MLVRIVELLHTARMAALPLRVLGESNHGVHPRREPAHVGGTVHKRHTGQRAIVLLVGLRLADALREQPSLHLLFGKVVHARRLEQGEEAIRLCRVTHNA